MKKAPPHLQPHILKIAKEQPPQRCYENIKVSTLKSKLIIKGGKNTTLPHLYNIRIDRFIIQQKPKENQVIKQRPPIHFTI